MTDPSVSVETLLEEAGETSLHAAIVSRHIRRLDPEKAGSELETLRVRLREDGSGVVEVRSRKAKNCLLNWKGLVFDLGLHLLTAPSVADSRTAALFALRAVKILSDAATIALSDREADTLLALWRDRKEGEPISDTDLQAALGFNDPDYERTIMRLQTLGIIARRESDGRIVRTERIYFM